MPQITHVGQGGAHLDFFDMCSNVRIYGLNALKHLFCAAVFNIQILLWWQSQPGFTIFQGDDVCLACALRREFRIRYIIATEHHEFIVDVKSSHAVMIADGHIRIYHEKIGRLMDPDVVRITVETDKHGKGGGAQLAAFYFCDGFFRYLFFTD